MTDEIADFPHLVVLQTMPVAVSRSLASYQDFSGQSAPNDAKNFVAYHNACKAALGHIAALLKLNVLCRKNAPEKSGNKSEELEQLLRQARHILLSTESADDTEKDQS